MSNWSVECINSLMDINRGTSYLEVGVHNGSTFLNLHFPRMVGVDPKFAFSFLDYEDAPARSFHQVTSDHFFAELPCQTSFDLVFLDGLHHYDQTYRDFCNALVTTHSNSFILIDDVLPCDKYSAMRDMGKCFSERSIHEPDSSNRVSWHGDVFKMIPQILLYHSTLSYATISDQRNYQTVVWRKNAFNSSPVPLPDFRNSPSFNPGELRSFIEDMSSIDYGWIRSNMEIYNLAPRADILKFLAYAKTSL